MVSLAQIRSFVAVFEERSFTAAAKREAATQSGISQHVRRLEAELGAPLFERAGHATRPTPAGRHYYRECAAILRRLDEAGREVRHGPRGAGRIRVGLMPTFTRRALPRVLDSFLAAMPGVDVHVTEAYSGTLTEMVRSGELDFAVVPAFEGAIGLSSRLLARDREVLVAAKGRTGHAHSPVRLRDLGPLKLVLPGMQNVRRRNLETYFATNGVEVARRVELDAMIGTLEFVAQTNWVAVLPGILMGVRLDSQRYEVRPLDQPPLHADFVLIEPARRTTDPAARAFADMLTDYVRRETSQIQPDPAL